MEKELEEKGTEEKPEIQLKSCDLGKVNDEKEVIDGYTVKLETLSVGEQDNVLKHLSDNMNQIENFHHLQKWTLAYATRKFNGEKITDENRGIVEKFYFGLQDKVLTPFYNFYLELVAKQREIIEALKKN